MGIQAQVTAGNSKENATIAEPRVIRKPTVGKRKRMLTSIQRIGRKGTRELR